jgi:hypothetical protein
MPYAPPVRGVMGCVATKFCTPTHSLHCTRPHTSTQSCGTMEPACLGTRGVAQFWFSWLIYMHVLASSACHHAAGLAVLLVLMAHLHTCIGFVCMSPCSWSCCSFGSHGSSTCMHWLRLHVTMQLVLLFFWFSWLIYMHVLASSACHHAAGLAVLLVLMAHLHACIGFVCMSPCSWSCCSWLHAPFLFACDSPPTNTPAWPTLCWAVSCVFFFCCLRLPVRVSTPPRPR